jgi:hypothetical protein
MKRMACVVVVGSFLAIPVAFAQSAPKPMPAPSDVLAPSGTTPKASAREADFYEPSPRTASEGVKGSLDDGAATESHSGAASSVRGSFEGTNPMDVKASFDDTDTSF